MAQALWKAQRLKHAPRATVTGKSMRAKAFLPLNERALNAMEWDKLSKIPVKHATAQDASAKEKTLSVTIPAGIEEGARIRLAGEGEAGLRGGASGDLYIFLHIKPHKFFKRDGSNIYCRVPISMTTATLGGEIDVPAIDGHPARVKVPEGTQSGKQFRLKGKGMTVMRSSARGDMYIETTVETPVNITKRQKELLEEFASLEKKSHSSPLSEGFFSKIKDLWG